LTQLDEYEKIEWFFEIKKIKTGNSFGELALINHEPRAATIKCLSTCYLAVLSKEDYAKVLRKSQLRE
jgi:CRP-like cAMP-binding protein